ncbi:hypothetical protein [Halobacillus sp. Nhm2S1]|uniref:hypothetical protein n=1 Tax=Halobacillus sp. Nhm2S1 TaxID=2866716 RepID=UPI001C73363B|nr:hypothetical protein [Halobacillus sp. Nhm2S1]MBX0356847.1 hypothetical protein [Halobacillus sp. Nhm2S1]
MGIGYSKKSKQLEVLLWSIALPGFGQLLNGKYIKGILLVALELLVNVMGNFNKIIILSFHFRIEEAITETNYMWLMFYPCLYFFSIWDAYKDAGGGEEKPFAYLPFVSSAYFVTLGLIFSSEFTLFGYFIGPLWLPVLFLPVGLGIGESVRRLLLKDLPKESV